MIDDIPKPDLAISMGCNVGCPFIRRAFDDNWELDDPTGKSDDDLKDIKNDYRNTPQDIGQTGFQEMLAQ